jgi:predicted RNA binding protein YcfA (HicA-like mRNA interferase family)
MKRADLIRKLVQDRCVLIRHGGRHDWYSNPRTGVSQPVPRHKEIKEFLAKHILKKLSG